MPRISKLPPHLNDKPEEFIRQYILDIEHKKLQERMTSEYRREQQKKREQAKVMKKVKFQGSDGNEKERSEIELLHLGVRSSLSNIDSPTVFLEMLLLQGKIDKSNKLAQTLELAAQYDLVLQKVVCGTDPARYPQSAKLLQAAMVNNKLKSYI